MLSSLANGLRVLEHLIAEGEVGVSETARALGLTVGTAHRLMGTLVDAGFVEQNRSSRRYRPSSKVTELARASHGDGDFIVIAHPYLERLKTAAGETVNMGVLRDDAVVYIDRVVTDQPLAVAVRIGSRIPAYCTALGRSLLAFGSQTQRQSYLERLDEIGEEAGETAPSRRELSHILDEARKRGYAEDNGEFSDDIACFAAPLMDPTEKAIAAISVSGPRTRMRRRKKELVPLVRSIAEELNDLLQSIRDPHL